MGLIKDFFSQTGKPEGVLGKLMLSSMNSGHAKLADWGMTYLDGIGDVLDAADLGCGAGRNLGELLRKYPSARICGLDHSALSVESASKYNSKAILEGRCKVVEGDVATLDLPDSSLDLVTAFETVYFWPGLSRCFREVNRVLRPGGHFLVCNESDGKDKTSKSFEKIIDGMTAYTADEIKAALIEAGFSDVAVNHHPSKPWIAVLATK